MKKKSITNVSFNSAKSVFHSNAPECIGEPSKPSDQLLAYYKSKCGKLEQDFDNLLEVLDQVKSTCDLSNELQTELSERNEEVSKLQQIVGELQIHLFKEKEKNLKLSAENDELKIQDFENKKRIKSLLMVTGVCERTKLHFVTKSSQNNLMPSKLPPKLKKLKDMKETEMLKDCNVIGNDIDPQVLLLNNELLAAQLQHHIKITRDQIKVLLKDKEISEEERKIERQRLKNEIDLLAAKLKQSQDLLCETSEKLIKSQQLFESDQTMWMEEKGRFLEAINAFKDQQGLDVSEILQYCITGVGSVHFRLKRENLKENLNTEREQIAALYQEQILALEAEVNRLRERALVCKNTFKEKTEKMSEQVSYLKNKYEDLNRRRHLEAEGFRTDIRMLKTRVKDLEKKLSKSSTTYQSAEQQQLLISARSTLSRAKQLEKELANMKLKILALESNEESVS